MAEAKIRTEPIDDIPLLVHQQKQMGIPATLNALFSPHGNRQGLSVGWLVTFWLAFILSEADHRMCEVESWAEERIETLSALAPEPVSIKDFTDDRLADVLRYFSDDETWTQVEVELGQRIIRVYELGRSPVRVDSTTSAVYHDTEGTTLFRHGHSKDHRPDLAQFKVMLGALDPLGLPIATLVVPGNEADDGLYVPTIRQAREIVGAGRLYIGDTKMAALATRARLEASGDYYLTPLPWTGDVPALLEEVLIPIWNHERTLNPITVAGDPTEKLVALGYDTTRLQEADIDDEIVTWEERLLVVFSLTLAKQQRRGLAQRLDHAEQELVALTPPRGRGRRQWDELEPLQDAVQAILNKRRVDGMLEISYEKEIERRHIRKYGDRPARTEERIRYVVHVERNQEAIREARRRMGWRLYVTNTSSDQLSVAEGVIAYRGTPRVDRNFRRLKGRPLGIRPLYVQRDDHAQGMVRLLSLALRVLTLTEHVVREKLCAANEALAGLYAGNPKRETARPTTERLLKAFQGIYLSIVELPGQTIRHVTSLSELQRRILRLLGLSPSIYENLQAANSSLPP